MIRRLIFIVVVGSMLFRGAPAEAQTFQWSQVPLDRVTQWVAVGTRADGRRLLFTLDNNGSMFTKTEVNPGSGTWTTSWEPLGGWLLNGPPIPVTEADGRVVVFVKGNDGHIYYIAHQIPNGPFGGWVRLTTDPGVSAFTVARNDDGRLELFAVQNGLLMHMTQWSAGSGFGPAEVLGGNSLRSTIAVGRRGDGSLAVFVVFGDGDVYTKSQIWGGSFLYSNWTHLGHASTPNIQRIRVGQNGGSIVLFMLTGNRDIWYRRTDASGAFSGPLTLFGLDMGFTLRVAQLSNDRVALFVNGGDGQLYYRYQLDAGRPDDFVNWNSVGMPTGGIFDVSNVNGETFVFSLGGIMRLDQGRSSF